MTSEQSTLKGSLSAYYPAVQGFFKFTNLFDNLFSEVKPSYYETDGQGNEVPWYPPHPDQIRYEPSTFPPLLLKIRK